MSPATNKHGMYQAKIVALLSRLLASGTMISKCSIQTREGVKVADVAWASDDFMRRNRRENPFPEAPELCVGILSPSNTLAKWTKRKILYFARGAMEFWIYGKNGDILFYKNTGALSQSEQVSQCSIRS